MKRVVQNTLQSTPVGQKRYVWWDRFVRNNAEGKWLSYVGPTNKAKFMPYSNVGRHDHFGYIPNTYEMEDRAMFDRKTLEPDRIRPPCAEIPDVQTFLERADVKTDLTEYSDSFEDWNELMTMSYMEMVYKKEISAKAAKTIFTARELYNNGHVFHKRDASGWKEWGKQRGSTPPFPENYYPHMRIAKYRSVVQETQSTGHKLRDWEKLRQQYSK
eukprot:TRINITY_DN2833_c0_g2_i1.p1 TRINITY_DN2833_c0_g2~~TRINITY_DN2833_c0_g2_i1.p1  ORF type:complete len:233 (+),score=47.29 TRINITY_DN2833_c0_g2_i1:56-700(+)